MTPRYLWGYGLVEAPLAACVERLEGARMSGPSKVGNPRPASRRDAVAHLSHLTFPATRWGLFAVNDRWTAIVTNERDGSDLEDPHSVAGCIGARVCRVVDQVGERRIVEGYTVRVGSPARVFELVEPDQPFPETARSIHAALDGDRWSFAATGRRALPIEATFDYEARLRRDRFTSENLAALLGSLGVEPSVRTAFETTDKIWLLERRLDDARWRRAVEADACTPEEAGDPGYAYLRRGLGWVPHLQTHAESVVWDLTCAVLLSPGLRPRAERHLDAARRRLGRKPAAKLEAEVEAYLRAGRG